MSVKVKKFWVSIRAAVRRRWDLAKTKRWFRPAAIGCGAFIAICLIGLSYAALFHRNHIADGKHGTHTAASHKSADDKKHTGGDTSAAPKNVPAASAGPSGAAQAYPGSILSLTDWYLTLPIAKPGTSDPQTIKQPQLNTFSLAPYFQVNGAGNGVIFQAQAGGATTENSQYPRSELREMTDNGADEASWSDTSGTNVMTIREAITHLPPAKPQVVAGQIHDSSDDVIEIRLEGANLFVDANGKNVGVLDSGYRLGAIFTVQIVAANGHIQVAYNGAPRVDYKKSGSGYYFKAGCYTQSNPSKGDSPSAYGEVVIYGLQVSHS